MTKKTFITRSDSDTHQTTYSSKRKNAYRFLLDEDEIKSLKRVDEVEELIGGMEGWDRGFTAEVQYRYYRCRAGTLIIAS